MIDEKKIEEAAREIADLYEQDLPIMSYNEDTEVDGQHHFCQEFGAKLFKEGAKWAINEFLKSLWHDADEEPKTFKRLIAKCHLDRVKYDDMMFLGTIPWNEKVKNKGINCWLYVDDLL